MKARLPRLLIVIAAAAAAISCSSFPAARFASEAQLRAVLARPPAYPEVRFAVASDLHYLDPELWSDGPAIEAYLHDDRKLLRESDEILREVTRMVREAGVELLLVPGDLTKDGELSSHLRVAAELRRLEASGVKVFVICGNHDLLNPEALRYDGERKIPVESVSPEQFADIYAEFGYEEALSRDPASLSYVAEPVPGLRILALDGCRYREPPIAGHARADGRFSAATLEWIDQALAAAALEGKAVLAFLHHGITEHYAGQQRFYGRYLIDRAPEVARLLAAYNVRVAATGHFHAQDITLVRWKDGKFVYDIETGSPVTYPCPVRIGEIRGNALRLQSLFVERIPSRPSGFRTFALQDATDGISRLAVDKMLRLKVREKDARFIALEAARAFMAHFTGDEQAPPLILEEKGLGFMGRMVVWSRRRLIAGLWTDLEPPDDNLVIDLDTGAWSRR